MKSAIISSLVLLLCVSAVFSAITIRKSKTKEDWGSGSWDQGFNVPGILIAKGTGALVQEGKGTFYAPKLFTPVTNAEKLGWTFTMTGTLGANLKQVMIADGAQYYIPYRFISSAVKYTNPDGYKFISFSVTNDNKDSFNIKVNLPYKMLGWYITDEEGTKIINQLGARKNEHQGNIHSVKSKATTASSDYMINKPLLDAANATGSNLDAAKKDAEAKLVAILASIKETMASKATVETAMAALNEKRLNQENIANTNNQKAMIMNSSKSAINESLKSLGGSATEQEAGRIRLEGIVAVAMTDLDAALNKLKEEAVTRDTQIDAAKSAVVAQDARLFSTQLNMVYP
jgi:hypothetical protein